MTVFYFQSPKCVFLGGKMLYSCIHTAWWDTKTEEGREWNKKRLWGLQQKRITVSWARWIHYLLVFHCVHLLWMPHLSMNNRAQLLGRLSGDKVRKQQHKEGGIPHCRPLKVGLISRAGSFYPTHTHTHTNSMASDLAGSTALGAAFSLI